MQHGFINAKAACQGIQESLVKLQAHFLEAQGGALKAGVGEEPWSCHRGVLLCG